MEETKIKWAVYYDGETTQEVHYTELDEDLYLQKYKGNLTCINGCEAKMKFTERKDGTKFFSTWNGEGKLHEEGVCPFHVKYKDSVGRKQLEEVHEKLALSDKQIVSSIRSKFRALKDKSTEKKDERGTTRNTKDKGKSSVNVYSDSGETTSEYNGRVRIGSLDANLITDDYINLRKCIFGKINHIHIGESNDNKSKYLYLNLRCKETNISVYFPAAFYYSENNSVNKFEMFSSKLEAIQNSEKSMIFVGVGFIKPKKNGKGLNLVILDKSHFMINETSYDSIRLNGAIKDDIYKYK